MGGWPWPLSAIQGWMESFWSAVNAGINALASQVSATLSSLTATIGGVVASARDAIVGAFDVAARAIGDGLAQAQLVIVGAVGQLGNAIVDGLKAAFAAVAGALQEAWKWIEANVLRPVLAGIQAAFEAATAAIKGMAATVVDLIREMAPHSPGGALDASVTLLGTTAALQIVASAASTALDAIHPFHSLEVKQAVFGAFNATGISLVGPTVLSRILDVALVQPMVQELNEIYLRAIPGASDLVRFVVREQISPEELGLWLGRQGFGPKWSTAFWGAHWIIPSREEAVELYHRGTYSLQQVTDNLVLNDRKPDTIADLLSLTWRTPSRAELERIVEVADVPEPQLREWLRADGVQDELLPTFLTLVRGRRLVRILTRVETLVRSQVEAGRLGLAEARSLLQEFRFAPEVVEAELRLASRARDLQLREELTAVNVEAFRKAVLPRSGLVEELLALGLDPDRVGSLVALEELRRRRAPSPVRAPTASSP